MKDLTEASQKLVSLVEILRNLGGLDLRARVEPVFADEERSRPELAVELEGSDTPLLIARNGELLHAIEHLAAKVLGLEEDEHDRISFDADKFKVKRDRDLQRLAAAAISEVRLKLLPHTFAPMMSRERRLLHLALASSGLKSASTGEPFRRSVILYPEGVVPPAD